MFLFSKNEDKNTINVENVRRKISLCHLFGTEINYSDWKNYKVSNYEQ